MTRPAVDSQSRLVKNLFRILLVGLCVLLAVPLLFVGVNRLRNVIDVSKEHRFLGSLRVGLSRLELYNLARSQNLPLSNPAFTVWRDENNANRLTTKPQEVGHLYLAVRQGIYPTPGSVDAHPSVTLFVNREGGIYHWPYDRIDIYFDTNDRVRTWRVSSGLTGL